MSGRIVFHGLPTATEEIPIANAIASPTLTEELPLFTAEKAAAEDAADAAAEAAEAEAAAAETHDAAISEEKYNGETNDEKEEIRISFSPQDDDHTAEPALVHEPAAEEEAKAAEPEAAAVEAAAVAEVAADAPVAEAVAVDAAAAAPAVDAAAAVSSAAAPSDAAVAPAAEVKVDPKVAAQTEKERVKAEKKAKEDAEKAEKKLKEDAAKAEKDRLKAEKKAKEEKESADKKTAKEAEKAAKLKAKEEKNKEKAEKEQKEKDDKAKAKKEKEEKSKGESEKPKEVDAASSADQANGQVAPAADSGNGVIVHVDRDSSSDREGDKNSVQHALLMLRNQRQQLEKLRSRVTWCSFLTIIISILAMLAFAVAIYYLIEKPDYLKSSSTDPRTAALVTNLDSAQSLLNSVNTTATTALLQSNAIAGSTPGLTVVPGTSVTVSVDGSTIQLDGSNRVSVKPSGITSASLSASISTLISQLTNAFLFTSTDTSLGPQTAGGLVTVGTSSGSLAIGSSVSLSSTTSVTTEAPTAALRNSATRGVFVSSTGATIQSSAAAAMTFASNDQATLQATRFTVTGPIQRTAAAVDATTIAGNAYLLDFSALPGSTVRLTGAPGADTTVSIINCDSTAIGLSITLINAMTSSMDTIKIAQSSCRNLNSVFLRPGDYVTLACISPVSPFSSVDCEKPSQAFSFGGFSQNIAPKVNLTWFGYIDLDPTYPINSVRLDAPVGIINFAYADDAVQWDSAYPSMFTFNNTFITPSTTAVFITFLDCPYPGVIISKQTIYDGYALLTFSVTGSVSVPAGYTQFRIAYQVI